MANDRRSKGCPNERCEKHIKKIKQKADIDYCPKCGTKMIHVCSKCFREIEDTDQKHRICYLCEAEAEEKRNKRIDTAKKVAGKAEKAVAEVVAPVVVGVVCKVIKDGQKSAIKVCVRAAKDVAKAVLKK